MDNFNVNEKAEWMQNKSKRTQHMPKPGRLRVISQQFLGRKCTHYVQQWWGYGGLSSFFFCPCAFDILHNFSPLNSPQESLPRANWVRIAKKLSGMVYKKYLLSTFLTSLAIIGFRVVYYHPAFSLIQPADCIQRDRHQSAFADICLEIVF